MQQIPCQEKGKRKQRWKNISLVVVAFEKGGTRLFAAEP
jgi:hypothetical protein